MLRITALVAALAGMALAAAPAGAATTVVSPAGLGPWQTFVTGADATTDASVSFVSGPLGQPAGTGSVRLDTGENHGDSGPQLLDNDAVNFPLAALKTLTYSTFGELIAGPSGNGQLPYLELSLDTTGDGIGDDTIVFEPLYQHGYRSDLPDQGAVQTGVWQTWDAVVGGWWSQSGQLANATPGFGVKTLSEILAAAPGARVVSALPGEGGLRVVLGQRDVPDHLAASVDNLTVDTGSGPSTFDFEPSVAPVFGSSVVVARAAGKVFVKTRHKGKRRLHKGKRVRLGSFIDASHGRVTLTSANDTHGTLQSGYFYGGRFKVRQRKRDRFTIASLVGPQCEPTANKASASRKKKKRTLWGNSHGNFRTVGQSASASTRGTKWNVTDYCDGTTKITVVRGTVLVHDFATDTFIPVTAPHSYLASVAN